MALIIFLFLFWKSFKKLKKLELSPQNFLYDVLHLLYSDMDFRIVVYVVLFFSLKLRFFSSKNIFFRINLVNKELLPDPWNVIMASDIWMGRLGEFDDNRIISRLWGPCNLSPKRARASKNWERIMSNYNNTKWPDLFKIVRKSRKVVYIAWIGINGQICWQVWHVFVTF